MYIDVERTVSVPSYLVTSVVVNDFNARHELRSEDLVGAYNLQYSPRATVDTIMG